MISIIITSFKEPQTIGKAIQSILNEKLADYELLVTAPDDETLSVARSYKNKGNLVTIKDDGEGKPAALSKALKRAKGKIIILTDGDVFIKSGSLRPLLAHFTNPIVGAVTGRVRSTNSRDNLLGYWAYILTEIFHQSRIYDVRTRKNVLCSGYLYAIRNNLVTNIPKNILADDAFISYTLISKGYQTVYEPRAEVHVRYPTTLADWIRQKKRTAGRLYQLEKSFHLSKTQSFFDELRASTHALTLLRNPLDVFRFLFLGLMKGYIWSRVFLDVRLWNRSYKKVWQRVNTTK